MLNVFPLETTINHSKQYICVGWNRLIKAVCLIYDALFMKPYFLSLNKQKEHPTQRCTRLKTPLHCHIRHHHN